jgi:hypothetical protein
VERAAADAEFFGSEGLAPKWIFTDSAKSIDINGAFYEFVFVSVNG